MEKIHKVLKINDLRTVLRPFLGVRLALAGAAALFFTACGGHDSPEGRSPGAALCSDSVKFSLSEYSSLFRMGSSCGADVAEIRSFVGRDTLVKRFVLAGPSLDSAKLALWEGGREWKGATVLRVPVRRAVVLSSAQLGFMERLGVEDRIVGVGEGKYIVDSSLAANVAAGNVLEVGNGPQVSLEKVVSLRPDLVMTFATGGAYDDYDRLKTLGIPLMLTSEWQEESPLAKFEWIKLFAKLFGAESLADSIYRQSKTQFEALGNGGVAGATPAEGVADAAGGRSEGEASPRVIAGMAYGGVWYAPGGRSYTASLIRLAGGKYLWDSDTTREMKFSLEEIIALADSADVWVNPGIYGTPEDILAAEPRLSRVRAFREKRVCQNDARKSAGGGNDFYESAVAHPVELVRNLRECLYTEISGDSGQKTAPSADRWYRNIYN